MNEAEQKAHDTKIYEKGKEDGAYLANQLTTMQLNSIVYDATLSWFERWCLRRNSRLMTYVDNLWEEYGPTEDYIR